MHTSSSNTIEKVSCLYISCPGNAQHVRRYADTPIRRIADQIRACFSRTRSPRIGAGARGLKGPGNR